MSKKLIAVLLSAFMIVSVFAGCKKKNDGGSNDNKGEVAEVNELLPATVKSTGNKFVEGGKTDYSIVTVENADPLILTAAYELQTFIKESTGATLEVKNDDGAGLVNDLKVISLGNTSIFNDSGLSVPKSVGESGYVMKTVGKSVIINANDPNGMVSAVYDMLNYLVNFEVYAADELYYEKKTDLDLLDYDITFKATIDLRNLAHRTVTSDSAYARRLRLFSVAGLGIWVSFAHTVISDYLPTDKYLAGHPDWYNGAHNQVCYSNDEMRLAMEEEIKDRIIRNPDGKFVMIGHEDNYSMCDCAKCVDAREKMGGYGGQELDFTNKVAVDLDAWLAENYPDRELRYIFFAYQTSSEPPVKYDETAKKYVPVRSDFEVKDNVYVLYCPIESDFSKPLTDPVNSAQYEQLSGWKDAFAAAGKDANIMIWTYSIPCYSYFVPLDNFGVYGEHYRTFKDLGVSYVFDQSVYDSATPGFESLKIYTQAKLMWREDLSYDDLAEDFINHYYGNAAEEIKKYHDFIRSYYKYLEETKSFSGKIMFLGDEELFWPYAVVKDMIDMLEDAVKAIEPLKTTNPENYEKYLSRIRREELTPIYLAFKHHMNSLTQSQKEEYWYILDKYTREYDIVATKESSLDVVTMVETWRGEIFD